ncbi:MFS transporter [Streptomyces scopuliridis]|uniref:MFS transporter n=1 Tax=Streptomyces scopuliridis TaxID=452529 RepID=A0ACD4ZU77_9ACTN|nr:MFS transporter [Streptomyces scopuliridis]WSC00622.1 MFS transporter [Streptomyces scopuliridis]WSC05767.1 MFS transporter [Streptomyces scopuliridis]
MSATAVPTPAAPAPERPAHRDRNVLRWLAAYTASMVGDSVYYMALSWAAIRTGSPGQAGLVLALGAVPRAVLMLGGGVLADRFGPRRVVIGSDAARCVFILGIAVALLFTTPSLWLLITVALVFGAVDALFLPAVGALPPRITAPGQLARVQGMRGLAARIANVTGAPLGGLAVALGGSAMAFAVAGLAYAPSLGLAVLAGVFIGLLAGLSGALTGALLQTAADPAYLGRVTSVATLFSLGVAPLCYPVTGAAVGLWGTGPVFVVSAAVCGTGGVLGLCFKALRRAELPAP